MASSLVKSFKMGWHVPSPSFPPPRVPALLSPSKGYFLQAFGCMYSETFPFSPFFSAASPLPSPLIMCTHVGTEISTKTQSMEGLRSQTGCLPPFAVPQTLLPASGFISSRLTSVSCRPMAKVLMLHPQ